MLGSTFLKLKFTQCSPKASRSYRVSFVVEAMNIGNYSSLLHFSDRSLAMLAYLTATSTGEKFGLDIRLLVFRYRNMSYSEVIGDGATDLEYFIICRYLTLKFRSVNGYICCKNFDFSCKMQKFD
jgi:hypothetical protein